MLPWENLLIENKNVQSEFSSIEAILIFVNFKFSLVLFGLLNSITVSKCYVNNSYSITHVSIVKNKKSQAKSLYYLQVNEKWINSSHTKIDIPVRKVSETGF